jgi:RHS repeat-associated protein
LTNSANYGRDNGSTRYVYDTSGTLIDSNSNGIPDEAEGPPRLPNTSNDYIATKFEYDAAGFPNKKTDNLGRIQENTFDRRGAVLKTIENFVDGTATETELDTDRTTETVYGNGGRIDKLRAYNPKGAGNGVQTQETKYLYESPINVSWPTSIIYPDSSDVNSSGTDQEKYTYDRLGRRLTFTDQRGVVHTYTYDGAGRFAKDAVTTFPSQTYLLGTVKRIERGYDDISRLNLITSYDAATAGTIVNQLQLTYNEMYQISKSQQDTYGAVYAGTPFVIYTYADGASNGVAKFVRLTQIGYPGTTRMLYFNYPSSGTLGDHVDHLDNIAQDALGTTREIDYSNANTYLGVGWLTKSYYPGVSGGLYTSLDTGGNWGAMDRFGRVTEQLWINNLDTTYAVHDFHTYDRVGNRNFRQTVATGAPKGKDEYYQYDGLNRLTKFNRGTLSGGTISDASANFNAQWTALESLGNWRGFQWDPTGGANSFIVQSRTHNAANETTAVTNTGASSWIAPTYDAAGNMTQGPKVGSETTRLHYFYDAWNRLGHVSADNAGSPGTVLATYRYDGLGRLNHKQILPPTGGDQIDYYYDENWRIIGVWNEPNGSTSRLNALYIWDQRYIDALAIRYRNADNSADGSVEEKLYFVQDANYNTAALVNTAGIAVERYQYDAYGGVTVMNGSWTVLPGGTAYANDRLFCGYRYDYDMNLYDVRNRNYHPTLGRWIQRDPIRYANGMNLYQYVRSCPVALTDWLGLAPCPTPRFETDGSSAYNNAGVGTLARGFGTLASKLPLAYTLDAAVTNALLAAAKKCTADCPFYVNEDVILAQQPCSKVDTEIVKAPFVKPQKRENITCRATVAGHCQKCKPDDGPKFEPAPAPVPTGNTGDDYSFEDYKDAYLQDFGALPAGTSMGGSTGITTGAGTGASTPVPGGPAPGPTPKPPGPLPATGPGPRGPGRFPVPGPKPLEIIE